RMPGSRQLVSDGEIQAAYAGTETVAGYVAARFANALNRLLHDRQVAVVQRHGRQETHCVVVVEDPEGLPERGNWPKLNVIGMCYSERKDGDGQTTFQTRYFFGSKRAKARYYGKALRGQWGIENDLHWSLDVTYREDHSRVQQRHAAENLALVRRLALN